MARGRRGDEGAVLRPGGQALLDGVFMRTDQAWAIARANGSVEVGAMPQSSMKDVPVGRVIGGLSSALKVGVARGLMRTSGDASAKRALKRRLLAALALGEGAVLLVSHLLGRLDLPVWTKPATAVLTIVTALAAVRLTLPAPLWRYHGAEHKAVSAFEQGVDLSDVAAVLECPRVHNRCGTNLVFLLALAGAALDGLALVVQVPLFVLTIGVGAELVSAAARRPSAALSRLVLGGGKWLQRRLTTAEPSFAEQAVACVALEACLAEHARLVAAAELADAVTLAA